MLYFNHLKSRITLEKPKYFTDGSGGQNVIWLNHSQLWAYIECVVVNDSNMEGLYLEVRTYKFTIRNNSDVDCTMRVMYKGSTFSITSIAHDNKFSFLVTEMVGNNDY